MDDNGCVIDDFGPLPVVRPSSAAELGRLVRESAASGRAVYPVGGRTLLGVGMPPDKPGTVADLRGLDAVDDYPARDLTVTVQAGVTLAALRRLLASENQELPIDVPQPERATLGGALAANASGPRRYGRGTFRDYVLGMSWVNDEGHEVKAGGRVVKNVAGYDLPKLHVGALGTLGVITRVTLKLRPLPEARVLLLLGAAGDSMGPLLDLLHRTATRPVCLDLLNRPAARALAASARVGLPDAPWLAALGFEDNEEAVGWQVKNAMREVAAAGAHGLEVRAGAAGNGLWAALTESTARPEARLGFKANLLPSALADFCLAADALPEAPSLHAHAGSGVVRGHFFGDLTPGRSAEILNGLTDRAVAARGNLVLPHCPPEWKRSLPVWGRPRNDAWLAERVRDALDPRRLFNPGRFV